MVCSQEERRPQATATRADFTSLSWRAAIIGEEGMAWSAGSLAGLGSASICWYFTLSWYFTIATTSLVFCCIAIGSGGVDAEGAIHKTIDQESRKSFTTGVSSGWKRVRASLQARMESSPGVQRLRSLGDEVLDDPRLRRLTDIDLGNRLKTGPQTPALYSTVAHC